MKPSPEGTRTCLHLVAGPGREALDDCLAHSDKGDALLFLDAGALHVLRQAAGSTVGAADLYYLAADLQAHGLLELARRLEVSVLDDAAFCELLAAHDHCLTWT